MEYKKYTLYVEPIDWPGVSRTLEIGGNRTLDDLSEAILDAWDFDHSHLYMFSLTRKPYDPDGFYHPYDEDKNNAAFASLDSLGLKSRRKILYLYDFGDDWMFYVTVKRVETTGEEPPVRVIQSEGALEQYPNWNDEDWDEDEGELRIEFVETPDPVLESLLEEVPALYQNEWLLLAREEYPAADDEEIYLFGNMEKAGLLEMAEIPEGLLLKVRRGTKDPGSYLWVKDLGKRLDRERMLAGFVMAYGLIEEDELCRLCSEAGPYGSGHREEFEKLAGRMKKQEMFQVMEKNGTSWVSCYPPALMEEIWKKRENYPVNKMVPGMER